MAACGDGSKASCLATDIVGDVKPGCIGALIFAARDTDSLVPTQSEIDRYHDRWSRAVSAEPLLLHQVPQIHRMDALGQINLTVSNQQIIDAWTGYSGSESVPVTGVSEFDDIMSRLMNPHVNHEGYDSGSGIWLYSLTTDSIFNEERLAHAIVPTGVSLPDPVSHPQSEGTWEWESLPVGTGSDDSTAIVEFTLGWGDCFSGCIGFRSLRIVAPASEQVIVFDLGGDPLPPDMMLSPDTIPAP
jgi:hypothetical protein